MNKIAALSEVRPTSAIDLPDTKIQARETFGIDADMEVPAFSVRTEHVPDIDTAYQFDKETTLAICAGFAFNRRTMIQGYHGTGKVDPYRAGRGTAELALHPGQSRQPHQPHRPDRQGCDRSEGRQAGHRVPRGHPALDLAARLRAGVRRVRRRPTGRDVRHPARAGSRGQADPARPEPRDPPAPVLPAVLHRQHGRPWRHHRPLSRHPADQSGPDGPLEHRRDPELSAARAGNCDRARQDADRPAKTPRRGSGSRAWWRSPT